MIEIYLQVREYKDPRSIWSRISKARHHSSDSPNFMANHHPIKVLCAAGRLSEAAELFYDMIRKFDDGINTESEFVDWLMNDYVLRH